MNGSMPIRDFLPLRDPANPLHPPKEVFRWREESRINKVRTWDGTEAWLLTRYEDVKQALGDERFSANPRRPGFPEKNAAYAANLGTDHNVRTMDNPEHGIQKAMLARDFTVGRLQEMRPAIEAKTHKLIDDMLAHGGPLDFVPHFALALPVEVMCELLGVPVDDREYFAGLSNEATGNAESSEKSAEAGRKLNEYIDGLLDVKDKEPENDLLSRLVVNQLRTGALSRADIISLGRLMLIAGHETTAHQITHSTLMMFLYPEQRKELQETDDPRLIRNAVEEFLRFASITHNGRRRVATEDVEVGGQLIRAGEGVIVMTNMADRDETVFEEPNKLDIHRHNARQHMAFGFGIHQCMGQLLSRVELQIVHSILWKRMPNLQLNGGVEDLGYIENTSVLGIKTLPVAF
ncbi:MAG: cytochrome P450 [Flavobacteriaceae bacterium]